MKPIIIELTLNQLHLMESAFYAATIMAASGSPGLIMAQIVGDRMAVHVLDNAQGIAYQRLIKVPPEFIGKTMKQTPAPGGEKGAG